MEYLNKDSTPSMRFFSESDNASIANELSELFLNNISNNDIKEMLFSDSLACFSSAGAVVGSYECDVRLDSHHGDQVLHVTATNQGTTDGVTCETSLDAVVTTHLETISQTQIEKILTDNYSITKKTTINQNTEGYELHQECTENGKKSTTIITYTKRALESFISEGANLVLQRLLVKKRFSVPFETSALDSDYIPSMMSYVYLGERNLTVDNTEITVYGIERVIHSKQNVPSSWQSYFLSDGHLLLRVQVGSKITVRAKTIPQLFIQEEYMPESVVSKPEFEWRDDIELCSKYLGKKEQLKANYLLYLRNNPVVKDMLADFIQSLLMQKPENTIEFAKEFFKNYSLHSLPNNMFLDSRV